MGPFKVIYLYIYMYIYIGPKVYTIWVHGPLGKQGASSRPFVASRDFPYAMERPLEQGAFGGNYAIIYEGYGFLYGII